MSSRFTWRHAVEYNIERHAAAFIHEKIPHAMSYPVPGLDNGFSGEGCKMQYVALGQIGVCG